MVFKEINVLEGIVQQIGEWPFAGIAVDMENRDHLFPNDNHDVLYENPLEDTGKMMGEMDMERVRYLVSTDEMSEENLGKIHWIVD